ncbi:MAG: hypothetical protein EBR85_00290 [Betaproteobacteria bacterium]|jgi:hypothetical protein|nr:hypothetical protein [Betaproteobacteria bacterium]
MQAAAPLVLALLLTGTAAPAWPHSCPLEMYKIDQALSRSNNLDPLLIKKVRELRAEGEKLHKQDKHGEAMLVLGSAKKLLKIE